MDYGAKARELCDRYQVQVTVHMRLQGGIAAALREARREALEEAARACDDRGAMWQREAEQVHVGVAVSIAKRQESAECARRIRKLGDEPGGTTT